ncbi:putative calcium-binding protein CML36, partial [Bidens hawaiensis]|uniref:putative calcium-binding protein CML36 n=1 Tax=Bidens hawaiensis TaxID=980011 RepID=UPI00404996A3
KTNTSSSSSSPDSSHHRKSVSNKTACWTPTSVLPRSSVALDVHYELIQAFRMLDADGDGRITRSELTNLLTRIGGSEPLSSDELSLIIDEIDADGDGTISLEEFSAISSAFGPPACDDELKGAFEFFDTDRDGRVTADELFEVFKVIGDGRCTLEDCKRMIRSVDKNGDGFVCFEDFTRMMEQQR